jgi:hypothetical protein
MIRKSGMDILGINVCFSFLKYLSSSFGLRNWMRNVPLRTAIGVSVNEEEGLVRIGGGPVDAVKAKADVYVVVVPGDVAGKELLRHVLSGLAVKLPKELREIVAKASVEEIREFIQYNKGRIMEN